MSNGKEEAAGLNLEFRSQKSEVRMGKGEWKNEYWNILRGRGIAWTKDG